MLFSAMINLLQVERERERDLNGPLVRSLIHTVNNNEIERKEELPKRRDKHMSQ